MWIRTPRLEDVPVELIHHIQSLLSVKEAARICILSKSWLHAWSTNPTIRLPECMMFATEEQKIKYIKWIDRTLLRYVDDNIPIETSKLHLHINNQNMASLAEKNGFGLRLPKIRVSRSFPLHSLLRLMIRLQFQMRYFLVKT